MVTLLAKIFIKDSEDKIKQREAYGMLCGVIGILFNVLLFICLLYTSPSPRDS